MADAASVRPTARAQAIGFIAWLALSFAAAAVGGVASADAGAFYAQLQRPGWAPPGWVFAPVWSVLYALQGAAAWLVWRERGPGAGRRPAALGVFVAQLVLNALWSWIFFAWRLGDVAFGAVLALLALIALTLVLFTRVRPTAGALLAPYLMWVCFAAALTYAIWQRNPELLR